MKDNKVTEIISDLTNKFSSETFSALSRKVYDFYHIFLSSLPYYII